MLPSNVFAYIYLITSSKQYIVLKESQGHWTLWNKKMV